MASATVLCALAIAVSQAPIAQASKGQFHTKCGLTNVAPDDPIVYPNQPGATHLHDFFGNTTTNAYSTLTSLLRGGTRCDVSGDTSAYWAPALIAPNGTVVTPDRMTAYYFSGDSGQTVSAFPSGLKMVAGAAAGGSPNVKVEGYNCGEGVPSSTTPLNCGSNQLKAVVIFPSCWDGRHLDSSDHRSHMAYPSGRGCPRGYPVTVPKLIVHVRYPITNGVGYRLSSDPGFHMSNGTSMHADFFNSWNETTLTQLVQACLNGVGRCSMN
jgi:hypothetical protein